ncbi:MAG TPA: hypothetical protein VIM56_07300 [Rhizomicrobium sp.]
MDRILKPELKLALSEPLLKRGCVNVIGLEQIKAAAGARWGKSRPLVCAQMETVLKRMLGPADFFAEVDDASFLVCTPAASIEESRVFCLRAAHDLHTSQLGSCDLNALRLAQITAVKDDNLEYATLTPGAIKEIASRAGIAASEAQPEVSLDRKSTFKTKTVPRPRFTPLWDAQHEAITTYRCDLPRDPFSLGVPPPQLNLREELAALLSRLTLATNALASHLSVGERFLLSFPIPYELLGSPVVRMEVASFCRTLSSALRSYLLFEISDLPYGVPQSRLSELVGSLRAFCRGVSAILPARIPSYSAYQGSNLFAIGLSLAPHHTGTTEMESEIFKLNAAAKRLHMKSIVLDAPTLDIVLAARDNGTSLISSPLIGLPVQEPTPIRHLTLDGVAIHALKGMRSFSNRSHTAA